MVETQYLIVKPFRNKVEMPSDKISSKQNHCFLTREQMWLDKIRKKLTKTRKKRDELQKIFDFSEARKIKC